MRRIRAPAPRMHQAVTQKTLDGELLRNYDYAVIDDSE